MVWLIILSLILAGIVFLLLEILVVPGTTLVGLAGLGLLIGATVLSFNHYGTTVGVLTLFGVLVLSFSAIALALKSGTWKKTMLGNELRGKVNVVEEGKVNRGDTGVTVTRLNPVGKALINGEYYEVRSKDNLIAEDSPIEVIKAEGNKIIVQPKTTQ